ncbi:hypothetical protein Anas_04811 [Armadillidium nasatum]|uniref:Uncharacterized protein n=1 Tax=Armadillidium nasatum TaxID=96803 RepID=A0A5N5T2M8_9CRUS|nr:hypothetical protein Anas_04811 [Armadillidium nasatum]
MDISRMTPEQCYKHPWLKKIFTKENKLKELDKENLRKYMSKRRWNKAINTFTALKRMGAVFDKNKERPTSDSATLDENIFLPSSTTEKRNNFPKFTKTCRTKMMLFFLKINLKLLNLNPIKDLDKLEEEYAAFYSPSGKHLFTISEDSSNAHHSPKQKKLKPIQEKKHNNFEDKQEKPMKIKYEDKNETEKTSQTKDIILKSIPTKPKNENEMKVPNAITESKEEKITNATSKSLSNEEVKNRSPSPSKYQNQIRKSNSSKEIAKSDAKFNNSIDKSTNIVLAASVPSKSSAYSGDKNNSNKNDISNEICNAKSSFKIAKHSLPSTQTTTAVTPSSNKIVNSLSISKDNRKPPIVCKTDIQKSSVSDNIFQTSRTFGLSGNHRHSCHCNTSASKNSTTNSLCFTNINDTKNNTAHSTQTSKAEKNFKNTFPLSHSKTIVNMHYKPDDANTSNPQTSGRTLQKSRTFVSNLKPSNYSLNKTSSSNLVDQLLNQFKPERRISYSNLRPVRRESPCSEGGTKNKDS